MEQSQQDVSLSQPIWVRVYKKNGPFCFPVPDPDHFSPFLLQNSLFFQGSQYLAIPFSSSYYCILNSSQLSDFFSFHQKHYLRFSYGDTFVKLSVFNICVNKPPYPFPLLLFFKKNIYIVIDFGEKGRGRDRNINDENESLTGCLLHAPDWGWRLAIRTCALDRNLIRDPSVHISMLFTLCQTG